jgi:hypothetical protein
VNVTSTSDWDTRRATAWAPGTRRRARVTTGGIGRSNFGMHHTGVRWKTVRCSTSSTIAGITCTAEAPVPITATRLPRRSREWSQRAVWTVVPSNVPTPGMSGIFGWVSTPVASITWRATISSPSRVVSVQACASSSKVAPVTRTPKRAFAGNPCRRAQSSA